MVYRIFVEKKKELANEAKALLSDAKTLLGIEALEDIRILNRYDAENITEELKAQNQLEWVQRMNSIQERASEIVCNELIYV